MKVIPIRPWSEDQAIAEGWELADPGPHRFAPAFEFFNHQVPADELVEYMRQRAIEAGKMPATQRVKWWQSHHEGSGDPSGYVAFPMTAEEFSQYGFILSAWLHVLVMELDGSGQRLFLASYTRPNGRHVKPADYVWADLFYSRDGGPWRVAAYDRIDEESGG